MLKTPKLLPNQNQQQQQQKKIRLAHKFLVMQKKKKFILPICDPFPMLDMCLQRVLSSGIPNNNNKTKPFRSICLLFGARRALQHWTYADAHTTHTHEGYIICVKKAKKKEPNRRHMLPVCPHFQMESVRLARKWNHLRLPHRRPPPPSCLVCIYFSIPEKGCEHRGKSKNSFNLVLLFVFHNNNSIIVRHTTHIFRHNTTHTNILCYT